jgi:hypothetical protein
MRAQTMETMPPRLPTMADGRSAPALSIGDRDPELADVLDKGLDEYNFAATGTSGWGGKILAAAEQEKHGYVETGRTLGIPGGGEDVRMFKRL